MILAQFLAEWALRSSVLILSGWLLMRLLRALRVPRVNDPSIRLAVWTAMLVGSLAIPAFTAALPRLPLTIARIQAERIELPIVVPDSSQPRHLASRGGAIEVGKRFDRVRAALALYVIVALALLLRLCVGLALSLRLLRRSRATGRVTEGVEIRESDSVSSPVTLGIARPAIVLPANWAQWEGAKLEAVLAHERSHIARHDPAVQLLSAIHRVLLWHSPMSWFLHRRIVRVAEEASDDAAIAVTRDRPFYAELLLDFMQVPTSPGQGVPMARYGRADQRISRILEGTELSRGVTRWIFAAVLASVAPIAYLASAAHVVAVSSPAQTPVSAGTPSGSLTTQASAEPEQAPAYLSAPGYMLALGEVSAYTVTVKPRVDGELMSVSFREGDMVHAGQLLASIDSRPYEIELSRAEGQLAQDQSAHIESRIKVDQAEIDRAKLQLTYAQVTAPITGVAGLRLIDPGNVVRAADTTGLLVITQVRPISVLFSIPEDRLPQVLARRKQGLELQVEAWNRDNSARIATGTLAAVDNQIDNQSGTAKLKAVFDNKDGELFPKQFVNVRLRLDLR